MSAEPTLEERVARLEAIEEVRLTAAAYCRAIDEERTRESLERLFAPGIVVHAREELEGRDAVLRYMQLAMVPLDEGWGAVGVP